MKRISPSILALLFVLCTVSAVSVVSAGPMVSAVSTISATDSEEETAAYIRAHYTKDEYSIPMRDGVHLFTAVYRPNDRLDPRPILMMRTPYSVRPYGADRYKEQLGPTAAYAHEGWIFVYQDVRGKFMSEGEFVNMRPHLDTKPTAEDVDESTDTYDSIEWLVHNIEGNNGRVGMWGISYPGFYVSAGIIDSHPALKAASPQAPIANWFFDDMHHHGAFILNLTFNFFAAFGKARTGPNTDEFERFDHKTPDGYQFFLDLGPLSNANERYLHGDIAFWNQITEHPNYDSFWQSRDIVPHLRNIRCSVLTVGGLYDAEDLYGPLHTYPAIEKNNPRIENNLVLGPWYHGAWTRGSGDSLGDADFGFKTSQWYQEQVELPFFRHHLDGGPDPKLPEALVFETGANRWRRFDQWPPKELRPRRIYLRAGGRLSFEPPEATADSYDQFLSDPMKPVPYTPRITTGWAREYMTEDQRFAAHRPDVLVYETEALEEDLSLAGPLSADLWVSTSEEDADWVVKLIDVLPPEYEGDDPEKKSWGGLQQMVRSEVLRGRFRNDYEHPEPFRPGEATPVHVQLQDVLHTFLRGHRLMIQIQSSWFPLVDRNPQNWVDNIFEATEEDFVPAQHRVYRAGDHASSLRVGVLE